MTQEVNRPDRSAEELLTASLMGELDPAGEAALDAALGADPALRRRREELAAVLGALREAAPAAGQLDPARRAALRRAAVAPPPAGRLLRLSRLASLAAALAVVVGGTWWATQDGALMSPETAASAPAPSLDAPAGAAAGMRAEDGKAAGDALAFRAPAGEPPSDSVDLGLQELGYLEAEPVVEEPVLAEVEMEEVELLGYTGAPDPSGGGQFRGPGDARPPKTALGKSAAAPGTPAPATPAAPSRLRAGIGAGSGDELTSIGYADADDLLDSDAWNYDLGESSAEEHEADQEFRREYLRRAGESRDGLRSEQRPAEPRCIVIDGYGRRYQDRRVVDDYLRRRPHEGPGDMFFRYYGDNPLVRAEEDAISTFAADVDTASYPLTRKYLVAGELPPKQAVRTEEFVNYFGQGLVAPVEDDFALSIDYAPTPFSGEGGGVFRFGLKAREVERADRKPLQLVFVIDRSGSMADGGRMGLVQRALELLVDQLRDDDTVGIVAFEESAHRILDPTPGAERWRIREAIRALETGGSTNAEAGLVMGYEMCERAFREGAVNRVVLCSDGVANTGETDQARILERIRRSAERAIDLTAIGVGLGNHNDVFLERIADTGNGSCHYVDDDIEARRVFVERFTGTMQTVARDVKVQVEFNPGVIRSWRQLGYENRALADADFRNDTVDAGEVGAGHEVVGLYEAQGHMGVALGDWVAKLRVRWFPDGSKEAQERELVLGLGEGGGRFELSAPRFRLAVVAAQYAEVLRRSYWAREDSYAELVAQADRLARDLPQDAAVRELRDMVLRTRELSDRLLPPRDELFLLVDESRRLRLLQAEVEGSGRESAELTAQLDELRLRNEELEQRIRELLER